MGQVHSAPPSEDLRKALNDYYVNKIKILDLRERYTFLANADFFEAFGTYNHEATCEHCGDQKISLFASRSTTTKTSRYTRSYQKKPAEKPVREQVIITKEGYKVHYPYCQSCGHVTHPRCDCGKCEEIRAHNYQGIINKCTDEHCSEVAPPNITQLDAETSFCLAWFLSYGDLAGASLNSSKSIALHENSILHISAFSEQEMTDKLKKLHIIKVDVNSVKRAVEMISPSEHVFHIAKLTYRISYEIDGLYNQIKQHCRQLFSNNASRDSVIELMGLLALRDALSFYHNLSKASKIPFNAPQELCTNLRFGINRLGLFRTAHCIEKTVRYARMLIDERGMHPAKAANSARSGLYNNWLNRDDQLRWNSREKSWDNFVFRESRRARLFQDLFLPFTLEYGMTPLFDLTISPIGIVKSTGVAADHQTN